MAKCKLFAVCSMQFAECDIICLLGHLSFACAASPSNSTCRQEISHDSEVKILTRSAHWRKAIQSALEKSNTRQVHWRKAIDLVQNTICTFLGSHTVGAG